MDTATETREETIDGAGAEEGQATQGRPLVLPSLEIKNFRAFKHLTVEKLGRVNLITGKNNVGKTSLLEALWLYAENGSPKAVQKILEDRNELGEPLQFLPVVGFVDPKYSATFSLNDAWLPYIASLFHNRGSINELSNPLTVGEIGQPTNSLVLELDWRNTILGSDGVQRFVAFTDSYLEALEGKALTAKPFLSVEKGPRKIRQFSLDQSTPETIYWQRASGGTSVFIPSTSLSDEERPRIWDEINLTGWEQEILTSLQILAPQVLALAFQQNQYTGRGRVPFVRQNEYRSKIPLKSLGQGMIKVLDIALGLASQSGGILLIDEIENGLHYSVLPDVWRLIFQTARRLNVQVFATTHSWDCIEAFQKAASEDDDPASGVLVRLTDKNGDIISTVFDEEELAIITRQQIEVR